MPETTVATCEGCGRDIHEDEDYTHNVVRLGDGTIDDQMWWCFDCYDPTDPMRYF